MKKNYLLYLAVSLIAPVVFSCTKPEDELDEGLDVASDAVLVLSETAIEVPSGGGSQSIAYQLKETVEGASIEAVSSESWVNQFNYDVDGVISFFVEPNEGPDRSATVTVLYGETSPCSFTVTQPDPKKVPDSFLDNTTWTAIKCDFDRERSLFYYCDTETHDFSSQYNPDDPDNPIRYITAGKFAADYAAAWNAAYPDDPKTTDYFLTFEFTDPATTEDGSGTYCDVEFRYNEAGEPTILMSTGVSTPAGATTILSVTGTYTYDRASSMLIVDDEAIKQRLYDDAGNLMDIIVLPRETLIHVEKSGEYLILRVEKTAWPHPDFAVDTYIPESKDQPSFGFNLNNFDLSQEFCIYGGLTYTFKPWTPEESDEQ